MSGELLAYKCPIYLAFRLFVRIGGGGAGGGGSRGGEDDDDDAGRVAVSSFSFFFVSSALFSFPPSYRTPFLDSGKRSSLFPLPLPLFRDTHPICRRSNITEAFEPKVYTKTKAAEMEVFGKMVAEPTNVIFLSSILNREDGQPSHKCDVHCQNERVCGNIYRCKLTGITHICDKNCNQRILYDNHSSLCRVSGQIFPLTLAELQAVRGVRRKLEAENSEGCAFNKRRRDVRLHPSPFERSFSAVAPICSQNGDGMDMS